MIEYLSAKTINPGLKTLVRRGPSANTPDGFCNGITADELPELVQFAADHGLKGVETISNIWGRCHIGPHKDPSALSLLWAISWGKDVEFYSGDEIVKLKPGGLYLFTANKLHGIYNPKGQLWSCFVLDVEIINKCANLKD